MEKIPFFALSLLFGIVALGGKSDQLQTVSLWGHVLLALRMVSFALGKIFLPFHLSVFYPELTSVSLLNPAYLLSFFLLCGVGVLLFFARRARWLLFGVLFFLITFAPSFATVVKGGGIYLFSDRYTYVPIVGMAFLLVSLFLQVKIKTLQKIFPLRHRLIALSVLLLLFVPLTAYRSLLWGDGLKLFGDVVERYPQFHLGRITYGALLRVDDRYDAAIAEFETALALQPMGNTYGLIGQVEAERGNFDAAILSFKRGLEMDPEDTELLYGLGQVYALHGQSDEALDAYERALQLTPPEEDRYRMFARTIASRRDRILLRMGVLLGERGEHERALALYQEALDENPFGPNLHFNLAVSLGHLGQTAQAIEHYRRAVDLAPDHVPARMNLGILLGRLGNTKEAAQQFRAVLKIEPGNAEAKRFLKEIEG